MVGFELDLPVSGVGSRHLAIDTTPRNTSFEDLSCKIAIHKAGK